MTESAAPVVVVGGGPAGLTAAYELVRHGVWPIVLEKHDAVGGLARTEHYRGFHFDMGGHRFFTKSKPIENLWHEILGDELLVRPRLSRIFYKKKFFPYPLKPLHTLRNLGLVESVLVVLSYLRWQLFPHRQEDSFEQWVTNRFGARLFNTFFKTYTEKVWGIPCSELKAEWAAQRIKDLSLKTLLLSMLVHPGQRITTLIDEFYYPRLGPGMFWRAVQQRIEEFGGEVRLRCDVVRIERTGNRLSTIDVREGDRTTPLMAQHVISSMPITEFIDKLMPPAPDRVRDAARKLRYRDFLTVCLIVDRPHLFPDNWIYVHDPDVRVGRIQNYKNWSAAMAGDATKTNCGLEYFCNEGDELWSRPDRELISLATSELAEIGLARAEDVVDGCVFRVPKSYPVYDAHYRDHLATIRAFVDSLENFQTIGRNGLHRYNNQDHAMMTGLLAVRNLLHGENHDLWDVNTDQEYHEEVRGGAESNRQ